MILVSFYKDICGGTYYSDCAKRLRAKCEELQQEYIIIEKDYGKKWIDNVRGKPYFLKEILNSTSEDICWLDVDCLLLKKIDFPAIEWTIDIRKNNTPHDYVHIIKNNDKARNFIDMWIEEEERFKDKGSHVCFINICNNLNLTYIPEGYFELKLAKNDSKKEFFTKNNIHETFYNK